MRIVFTRPHLRCCHHLRNPSTLRGIAAFSLGLRNTLPFRVACHREMVSALRLCGPTSAHRIAPAMRAMRDHLRPSKQRMACMGSDGRSRLLEHAKAQPRYTTTRRAY